MIRCPACDSFVKPSNVTDGACPFCPTSRAGQRRNPIPGVLPGVVLAAALSGAPACGDDDGGTKVDASANSDASPAYGIAIDATPAQPDASPVYGVATDPNGSETE